MDKLPQIEEKVVESEDIPVDPEGEEEPLPPVLDEVVKEKELIPQEEIFTKKNNKDSLPEVKKIKKPKRQISDAQRERLRLGREKALANRRAKAAAKKTNKEKESIPQELKEEFKKTAVKETSQEISQAQPLQQTMIKAPPAPSVSKDELIELTAKASAKALEDYELVRKQRKEEKKKRLQEEKQREEIRKTIHRATKGPAAETDPFAFCFA